MPAAGSLDVGPPRTKAERAAMFEIRFVVFVDEQGVPEELELDHHEETSRFALARVDGAPVGCLRFREEDGLVRVERVATLQSARGRGVGRALMAYVEREASVAWPGRPQFLHAQVRSIPFYEKLGFTVLGCSFDDAGIEHKAMIRLAAVGGLPVQLNRLTEGPAPVEARELILNALSEYRLNAEAYDRDLEDLGPVYGEGAFYVLHVGGRTAGTGAWAPLPGDGPSAEIRRMFLAPRARGLGLGRQLLQLLELDCAYSGTRRVVLETATALREALQLYEGSGYVRTREAPHTLRCDLRLEKTLPAAPH